jgi:hypothetical protein
MAYWLDEGWHGWPEIDTVGTAAAGLYSRCGSYIADAQTDGFIPTARARMYGTPEWIARLVEVGLWAVEEHGFRDTRYFPLNATKAEIEERRRKAAARQERYRQRHARESRASNASPDAGVILPPSPASPNGEGEGARAGRSPRPNARPAKPSLGIVVESTVDWCGRCHRDTRMDIDERDRSVPCSRCHPRRSA